MGRTLLRNCWLLKLKCSPPSTSILLSRMPCNFCGVLPRPKKMSWIDKLMKGQKCWLSYQFWVSLSHLTFYFYSLDNELIGVSFAAIAAAALKLSIKLCQPEMNWDTDLIYWTNFNDEELTVLVNHLVDLVEIGRYQSTKKPMSKVLNRYKSRLSSTPIFKK